MFKKQAPTFMPQAAAHKYAKYASVAKSNAYLRNFRVICALC